MKITQVIALTMCLAGCLAVSDTQVLVENQAGLSAARGHSVGVLPLNLKSGAISTDSVGAIRNHINSLLSTTLSSKLGDAEIKDVNTTSASLNNQNKLDKLSRLFATYDSTGVIDRQIAAEIGQAVATDYILVSRLLAGKVDIMISQGQSATLESMLVSRKTGEVIWSGAGEWKKGGMFGLGKAAPDKVALKLMDLTFRSLTM